MVKGERARRETWGRQKREWPRGRSVYLRSLSSTKLRSQAAPANGEMDVEERRGREKRVVESWPKVPFLPFWGRVVRGADAGLPGRKCRANLPAGRGWGRNRRQEAM